MPASAAGWHAGMTLPYVGWGTALGVDATVRVEGPPLTRRGDRFRAGWVEAAELVTGTASVITRFARPVDVVVVVIDDPVADAGRRLLLGLDGARQALGPDGEPIPPTTVVAGNRAMLAYRVEADPAGGQPVLGDGGQRDGLARHRRGGGDRRAGRCRRRTRRAGPRLDGRRRRAPWSRRGDGGLGAGRDAGTSPGRAADGSDHAAHGSGDAADGSVTAAASAVPAVTPPIGPIVARHRSADPPPPGADPPHPGTDAGPEGRARPARDAATAAEPETTAERRTSRRRRNARSTRRRGRGADRWWPWARSSSTASSSRPSRPGATSSTAPSPWTASPSVSTWPRSSSARPDT